MKEELWKIFENVNSWLKYAENKNTYIITFIGAQITIMKYFNCPLNFWLKVSFIFLGLCLFVCFCSFFPKTSISAWLYYFTKSNDDKKDTDNLLFYGDIAKYSLDNYIEKMSKHLKSEIKGDKYLEDLCSQIIINSSIAKAKFNLFKISFWFMLLGQISFVISLFV
jgi:hypothetical protein